MAPLAFNLLKDGGFIFFSEHIIPRTCMNHMENAGTLGLVP